jgi:hypothetical protein
VVVVAPGMAVDYTIKDIIEFNYWSPKKVVAC